MDRYFTADPDVERIFDIITPMLTAPLPKGRRRGDKTADDDSVRSRKKKKRETKRRRAAARQSVVEKIKTIVL